MNRHDERVSSFPMKLRNFRHLIGLTGAYRKNKRSDIHIKIDLARFFIENDMADL